MSHFRGVKISLTHPVCSDKANTNYGNFIALYSRRCCNIGRIVFQTIRYKNWSILNLFCIDKRRGMFRTNFVHNCNLYGQLKNIIYAIFTLIVMDGNSLKNTYLQSTHIFCMHVHTYIVST